MASSFDADYADASSVFAELFGVSVTLTRGGMVTTGVTAEAHQNSYQLVDAEGLTQRVDVRDYVIGLSDYAFGGTAADPRHGDRITETINGTAYTYEVMPLGDSQAATWTRTDGGSWLIHTKRVG